jgi:polar amino acid transport system substrate-binding protein
MYHKQSEASMKKIVALILLLCGAATAQTAEEAARQIESIQWMTEDYPPYNYTDEEDGQLKGITVDILMEMFQKAGVKLTRKDLKVLP